MSNDCFRKLAAERYCQNLLYQFQACDFQDEGINNCDCRSLKAKGAMLRIEMLMKVRTRLIFAHTYRAVMHTDAC